MDAAVFDEWCFYWKGRTSAALTAFQDSLDEAAVRELVGQILSDTGFPPLSLGASNLIVAMLLRLPQLPYDVLQVLCGALRPARRGYAETLGLALAHPLMADDLVFALVEKPGALAEEDRFIEAGWLYPLSYWVCVRNYAGAVSPRKRQLARRMHASLEAELANEPAVRRIICRLYGQWTESIDDLLATARGIAI